MVGGERNLAYALVPATTSSLFALANTSSSAIYEKIGKSGKSVFPDNAFPGNFRVEFSSYLANGWNVSTSAINFTESEMRGLYNVILNGTLFGVEGSSPAGCSENASRTDCLKMGFLPLVDWLSVRSTTLAASGTNLTTDKIVQDLQGAIGRLFCPDVSACFDVSVDAHRIPWIVGYVTKHLPKIAIELAVDGKNYGLVTTRTHAQIETGFYLTDLKFPGYDDGIPIPGFVPDDDRVKLSTKEITEHYKCDVTGKTEFTWARKFDSYSTFIAIGKGKTTQADREERYYVEFYTITFLFFR